MSSNTIEFDSPNEHASKRKRQSNISSSSETRAPTPNQLKILKACGVCGESICNPPSAARGQACLPHKNIVVTCANWKGGSCLAMSKLRDGQLRSPHFHLQCLKIPTTSECEMRKQVNEQLDIIAKKLKNSNTSTNTCIPSSPFFPIVIGDYLCPCCDVVGSSKYLFDYFMKFRERKIAFYQDEECVDTIGPFCSIGGESSDDFVHHQISQLRQSETSETANQIVNQSEIQLHHIRNILDRIEVQLEPDDDDDDDDDESDFEIYDHHDIGPKNVYAKVGDSDSETDIPQIQYSDTGLNRNFLVGQSVRLYCSMDNSYHTGRVIDCRTSQVERMGRLKASTIHRFKDSNNRLGVSSGSNLLLDREINETQYLIRFREGLDGRKVAVHQWLFLEEHPIQISIALIWGRVRPDADNSLEHTDDSITEKPGAKRFMPKYRPAQVFVRSALDMVPVKEINTNGELNPMNQAKNFSFINAFGLLFGRSYYHAIFRLSKRSSRKPIAMINVIEEEVDDKIDDRDSLGPSVTVGRFPAPHFIAADFMAPPQSMRNYLREKECQDEALAFATTFACMENEEQRRIRTWHKLPSTYSFY